MQPMVTANSPQEMEWCADADSTSSSSNAGKYNQNQEADSLSDDDDFSDEFSIIDSDDEKKGETRYQSHQMLHVSI